METLKGQVSESPVRIQTKADLRLLSPAGTAFGVILCACGVVMWLLSFCWFPWLQDFRGIAGNVIAAGVVLLLANGSNWGLKKLDECHSPVCDWILRKLKRRV
jgi:hypothetical protein